MMNFLESSSIHGFKYISARYNVKERIFWIISLIFSGLCTALLIHELITKIQNSPIVSYISEQPIPINEVDFPAITICSGLRSEIFQEKNQPFLRYETHSNIADYIDNSHFLFNSSKEDFKIVGRNTYYDLLQKVDKHEIKVEDLNMRILKRLQIVDLVTRQGTFQRLNISVSTENFLYYFNDFWKFTIKTAMRWYGRYTKVSEILTEHGLCYSFNLALGHKILDLDLVASDFRHEYFHTEGINTFDDRLMPRSIAVDTKIIADVASKGSYYNKIWNGPWEGSKLYVHDPYELPTQTMYSFFMYMYNTNYLWFEPQLFVTDESLYDMEPIDRNCYLEHEKVLKFFKIYTKHNCEHECMAEFVLQRCGCVEFFMIRNFTTRICSAIEKECFDGARNEFQQHKGTCKCLQPCSYIKYNIDFQPGTISLQIRRIDPLIVVYSTVETRLSGFKVNQFIRKKQFNEVDFLSFVGGLLGLFAGFSALSFVEVIYWMLVKIKSMNWTWMDKKIEPKIIFVAESRNSEELVVADDRKVDKNYQKFITKYFSESSIHGFKYLTSIKTFETIFWLLSLIFSLSLCATLIAQTNQKVPDSRVVSIDQNLRSIKTIPFPAVTYATYLYRLAKFQVLKENINNEYYKRIIEKNPQLKTEFIKYLTKLQGPSDVVIYTVRSYGADIGDMAEVIREASEAKYFRNQTASFNGKYSVKFSEVQLKSELGISFNLMNAEEILRIDEVGDILKYDRNLTMRSDPNHIPLEYPVNMDIRDQKFELYLYFQYHPKLYYRTLIGEGTPYIAIHPNNEHPNFCFENVKMTVLFNASVTAEVTPIITKTDDNLRNLDPKVRECYFEDERYLKFFKIYSENACNAECHTNISLKYCGCITIEHIYSPKHNLNFCRKINDLDCAFDIQRKYSAEIKSCSCLPSCNFINYKVEYIPNYDNDIGIDMEIKVRMNVENTILYRRYQQFTLSDVVSYIGGLLGLFAGISVLSLFEIVYFFTLRVISENWRVRGRVADERSLANRFN